MRGFVSLNKSMIRSFSTSVARRAAALQIFNDALKRADPYSSVFSFLNSDQCVIDGKHARDYSKVVVVGAGKGALPMVQASQHFFNDKIIDGQVVTKYTYSKGATFPHIMLTEAAYPVPDQNSVIGSKKIIEKVSHLGKDTLVLSLLSGGGSSLLCYPADPLTLSDIQNTTKMLYESGADIKEINSVRKHLSDIKGGRLSCAAYPAPIISLLISDVKDDDESSIASGPTSPDKTTYYDCYNILTKYNIWTTIPERVQDRICEGIKGLIEETPKFNNKCFRHNLIKIIGNNDQSLEAAGIRAKSLGYTPLTLYDGLEGEAHEMGAKLIQLAKQIQCGQHPLSPPVAIIVGGETTVNIGRIYGMGGRNQELALKAALDLRNERNITLLSSSTDGQDGMNDACGAVVDEFTIKQGEDKNLVAEQYFINKDSYNYFKELPDNHLITGPTGTNVMDVAVVIVDKFEEPNM
ncbi:hypothetical protein WA158_007077 [Blastocystis sp. Blastoise]